MKRWQEFGFFIFIYAVAIGVGLGAIQFIDVSLLGTLFVFDVVMTVVIFVFSLIVKNASVYDPFWSVIPPVLLFYTMVKLEAFGVVNCLLLGAITVWAIRLTYNWALNWESFEQQDWRYDLIKAKTKRFFPLASFSAIMLLPTLIVFAQVFVASEVIKANAAVSPIVIISTAIIIIATGIQGLSDIQMQEFRESKTETRIIDSGLWKYSRHPNYFAEILVWWGVYGFYIATYQQFNVVISAPIIMTLLFLCISIPMMEKKILLKRPEYAEYQKETSMLFPLPNRKNKDRLAVVE